MGAYLTIHDREPLLPLAEVISDLPTEFGGVNGIGAFHIWSSPSEAEGGERKSSPRRNIHLQVIAFQQAREDLHIAYAMLLTLA